MGPGKHNNLFMQVNTPDENTKISQILPKYCLQVGGMEEARQFHAVVGVDFNDLCGGVEDAGMVPLEI